MNGRNGNKKDKPAMGEGRWKNKAIFYLRSGYDIRLATIADRFLRPNPQPPKHWLIHTGIQTGIQQLQQDIGGIIGGIIGGSIGGGSSGIIGGGQHIWNQLIFPNLLRNKLPNFAHLFWNKKLRWMIAYNGRKTAHRTTTKSRPLTFGSYDDSRWVRWINIAFLSWFICYLKSIG